MIAAIYSGLDVLLPFSWLDHNFMKNALLAVLLVTPLFGLLSTMVVSSRMAVFFRFAGAWGVHRYCARGDSGAFVAAFFAGGVFRDFRAFYYLY